MGQVKTFVFTFERSATTKIVMMEQITCLPVNNDGFFILLKAENRY